MQSADENSFDACAYKHGVDSAGADQVIANTMGGYLSSDVPSAAVPGGKPTTYRAGQNNNEGDQQTVLIPVDASKEAEIAFECKFLLYWL